jgi:hypothetical protein
MEKRNQYNTKRLKPLLLLLLLLLALLVLSCQTEEKKTTNKTKIVLVHANDNKIEVPALIINKKNYTKIENLHFKHSVGGKPIKEETLVMMKYDSHFLDIKFECRNNPRLDQNYYTEDNSDMFMQEVFELFISKGEKSLENYLEIQLNPNNALFLGKIMYRYKSDFEYKSELINNEIAGVIHNVVKDRQNNIWSGHLRLPIALLNYPKATSDNIFRLNMYRIISNKDHFDKKWSNNVNNSTFACWSSTMAKTPQFHAPDYFGFLILD